MSTVSNALVSQAVQQAKQLPQSHGEKCVLSELGSVDVSRITDSCQSAFWVSYVV